MYELEDFGAMPSGHYANVAVLAGDALPVYYPQCTCGWRGITISTPFYRSEEEAIASMPEPYRTVALRWGIAYTTGPKAMLGDYKMAAIQVLHHISYEPTVDLAMAKAWQNETLKTVASGGDVLDQNRLREATSRYNDALYRSEIWNSVSLPAAPPPLPPEAEELIRGHKMAAGTATLSPKPIPAIERFDRG